MEGQTIAQGCARAKINLFLDVTGRRADGYHLIDGVMQSVSLCDDVRVERTMRTGEISLSVTGGEGVPADKRNLAWRAAEVFLARSGLSGGVRISLTKRIPAAGGLAGGSSDAACVLRLLNRLAGAHALPSEDLTALAVSLGADLAFCLNSPEGAMRTEGIGERLTRVPSLPPCRILIANAGEGVPTPWAYGLLDERYGDFSAGHDERRTQLARLLEGLQAGDPIAIARSCRNLFEEAVEPLRPRVSELKARMSAAGAYCAMMSGSGPSVFGLFHQNGTAETLCETLRAEGVTAFVTEPIGACGGI